MILTQLTGLIDSGLLFNEDDGIENKIDKIRFWIYSAVVAYPKDSLKDFTILHGTRVGKEFALTSITYSARIGLSFRKEEMPETSNKVFIGGSGEPEFKENWIRADADSNNNAKTSRNIYHCLDHTIKHIKDKATGGFPQVVGLYRGGNGRVFGIISDGKRAIGGREVGPELNLDSIEWRNSNFERMNPNSLRRKKGAPRHYF